MTVSSAVRRVVYAGDSASRNFSVPFRFLDRTDLRLIVANAAGVETPLVLDSDYLVTGAGLDTGGMVTTMLAVATGSRLLIKRDTSRLQPLDFSPFDAFPAEAQERALDRAMMVAQEDGDNLSRALTVPETDTATGSLVLPSVAARAGFVLAFDSNGKPVAGPSASQLASLIATAFTPGLTALGDAVSFVAAGTGAVARSVQDRLRDHISLMDFIPSALRAAIRAGTNTTVLTAYIASAVTACPDNGTIYVEPGKWRGLWDIPGNKSVSIEGAGYVSRLEATVAGSTVMKHNYDERRQGSRRIDNLSIDGRSLGSTTGLVCGNNAAGLALLHVNSSNVTIENCDVGCEIGDLQESIFTNLVCQFNTTGVVIQNDPAAGGATTLTFTGLRTQQNYVGLLAISNSIFPIGAWQFDQCLFQANGLCGFSVHGAVGGMGQIYALQFNAMHLEANGLTTTAGTTATIRGKVVRRAGGHLEGAVATVVQGQLGESIIDVASFVLRNGSALGCVDGSITGGDRLNIDADASSRVFFTGRNALNGEVTGVGDFNGAYFTGSGSMVGVPIVTPSIRPLNQYAGPGLFPNAPEAQNVTGCTASKVLDIDHGTIQRVVYGAGIGSTGANNCTFKAIGAAAAGDQIAISVLVRAAAPTTIALYALAASTQLRGPGAFNLTTVFQRILIYGLATASEPAGFDLFAYPTVAGGPTVEFTKMMVVSVAAGASMDTLHEMIRRGLYDDMRQPVYGTGIPTSGTWPRGKRIINSAPAVGAARAWVKVTTGAANVLGTDWINEGNL
ncbi:MAG: hypothetical protein ACOYLS_01270 [Polymorphobacter sp.]